MIFFSTHPHVMWAESKLSFGMIDYAYDLNSSNLIGFYYYNDMMTGANTGWLGSGYMHFGFLGMVLYALLVGLLLIIIDMLAKGREPGILIAIFFTPLLALFLSSDLTTAILTHGLLLAMFLIWVCRLGEHGSPTSQNIGKLTKNNSTL